MDYDTVRKSLKHGCVRPYQPGDMEQMAVIEAAFVYNAATRPEKLPRKELPAAQPAGRGRGN